MLIRSKEDFSSIRLNSSMLAKWVYSEPSECKKDKSSWAPVGQNDTLSSGKTWTFRDLHMLPPEVRIHLQRQDPAEAFELVLLLVPGCEASWKGHCPKSIQYIVQPQSKTSVGKAIEYGIKPSTEEKCGAPPPSYR
mmetsp:Transcript_109169/g.340224  ORF Transcript_109169/g.340224 Transcript_109169/m.340224 type:complete len:136 (-) Transcript_109169:862-1269(-)